MSALNVVQDWQARTAAAMIMTIAMVALDRLDSSKMMQSMRGLTASSAQVGDDG